MKRIIMLGICLALSQFSFAEVVVNPDGTAKMQWGGEQGLENAKKLMYQNPPSYPSSTTSENGWKVLGEKGSTSIAINPKSFALDGLNRPTMWTKVTREKKGSKVVTTKALMVADCDSQRLGMSHGITYDRYNNVIDDVTVPDWQVEMHSDDPDSPMYGFIKGLCKLKQDRE